MGKRKKGRSVKKNPNVNLESEEVVQAPHSFVIHRGLPGGHTLELTKDFRRVMEPFTATSLKERKKNTIKDFVSVAGPLHVSHLSIFSRTETGMFLKIARLPRGPTLSFKVHNFSLARDVVSSLKKQLVVEQAFKHSPLIVLNSFSGEGLQMKLMTSMFQNMFPTINLTSVDLNTVRRCVLMNYNPTTKLIDFRHYVIKLMPVGISKGVKKVVQGKVPNLSKCEDISEFLTKSGVLSESEFEDDPGNHVTLAQKIATRGNIESGKSAIRLSELGPRLTLQLIKIEDGLMDGEVLYHDLIHKTEEEKAEIEKKREQKKKLKEKRKKIQEQNTKLKEQQKLEMKEKSLKGMQKGKSETDILMSKSTREANQEVPVEEDDDREYYKEEVGEEPDQDLFTSSHSGTKRPATFHSYKSKRMKVDDEKKTYGGKKTNEKFGNKKRFDNDRKDKKFGKGGQKFKKSDGSDKRDKKFGGKKRGIDKTNSQNRDHRPIGGGHSKIGRKKYNSKKR
ncbi:protein Peter pan [Aethina tumida]|uniref:protein Peter pan n=1 Tax=Aethina tumida TaxID=116153 RepID=UPI0021493309|nr:protein Peter pan [Aethina tumida]